MLKVLRYTHEAKRVDAIISMILLASVGSVCQQKGWNDTYTETNIIGLSIARLREMRTVVSMLSFALAKLI